MFWLARILCRRGLAPSPIQLGLRNSRLGGTRIEAFKDPREIVLCLQPFFGAPVLLVSRGYLSSRSGVQIDEELANYLRKSSRFRRILATWTLVPSWITHWGFTSKPSPLRAVGMALVLPWHRLLLAIAGRRLDPASPLPGFASVMTPPLASL